MSVVIQNVSTHDDLSGENEYVVRFNHEPPLASFKHVRSEGLAVCLRRAADALDRQASDDIAAFAAKLADQAEARSRAQGGMDKGVG